jgi:hypothetical protein
MARLRGGPSGNVVVISDSAVHRPGGQQPGLGGGEAAEQRGQRKHDDAGDEDPAPAEDVTGPAAEQQQAAERQRVGVHHPLEPGAREAERVLDVWQRHVHDRGVQHHHELRGGDDHQGEPEMASGRPAGCRPPGGGLCRTHASPCQGIGVLSRAGGAARGSFYLG